MHDRLGKLDLLCRNIFVVDLFFNDVVVQDSMAAKMLVFVGVPAELPSYCGLMEFVRVSLASEGREFRRSQVQGSFSEKYPFVQLLRDHFLFIKFVDRIIIGRNIARVEEIQFIARPFLEPLHDIRQVAFEEFGDFRVFLNIFDTEHFQYFFFYAQLDFLLAAVVIHFVFEGVRPQVLPGKVEHC